MGRTGTFIALDYLMDQGHEEGLVDLFKYAALMRTCRINMIQTLVGQFSYFLKTKFHHSIITPKTAYYCLWLFIFNILMAYIYQL